MRQDVGAFALRAKFRSVKNECYSDALAGHILTNPGAAAGSSRIGACVFPHSIAKVSPRIRAKTSPHIINIRSRGFHARARRLEAASG